MMQTNGNRQILEALSVALKGGKKPDSSMMLEHLFERITSLKGEKGDKGDPGFTPIKGVHYRDGKDGYTPQRGIDYQRDGKDGYTPQKGIDYFDGKDGRDGKDGKPGRNGSDATVDWAEVRDIATKELQKHEKKFKHDKIDPFLIGSKHLDESSIADKRVLMFDERKNALVYADMRGKYGGGASFASLANHPFTITTYTADFTAAEGISVVDATAGNVTITMPLSSAGRTGRPFIFNRKDASSNTVTFSFAGSDTLEGLTTYQLASQWAKTAMVPDGSSTYYFLW